MLTKFQLENVKTGLSSLALAPALNIDKSAHKSSQASVDNSTFLLNSIVIKLTTELELKNQVGKRFPPRKSADHENQLEFELENVLRQLSPNMC